MGRIMAAWNDLYLKQIEKNDHDSISYQIIN